MQISILSALTLAPHLNLTLSSIMILVFEKNVIYKNEGIFFRYFVIFPQCNYVNFLFS